MGITSVGSNGSATLYESFSTRLATLSQLASVGSASVSLQHQAQATGTSREVIPGETRGMLEDQEADVSSVFVIVSTLLGCTSKKKCYSKSNGDTTTNYNGQPGYLTDVLGTGFCPVGPVRFERS